ncbi:MAG: anthranilate phosphoribosyltransferase [Bacteroidota bacterium]|jgi:anthranilate phosphoribosyltransferase
MKAILNHLFEHKNLDRSQANSLMMQLAEGRFNNSELSSLITVFLMRSISIDELMGFKDALLELALEPELEEYGAIDIVGTGGDGKNTFNISTLACLVVAGAGFKVSKHGNYGASSISGASNAMEFLGYRFKNKSDELRKEIDQTNFCFLHAPLFHPALKNVASVRKELGFRTIFNMLGPLVNPAKPACQLIGVYNLEMARIYNYLLQQDKRPFCIVHSLEGYDEISLTGDTKMITSSGEHIKSAIELAGIVVKPEEISGGKTVAESARIFLDILQNEGTQAQKMVVLANAASALLLTGSFTSYQDAFAAAQKSLLSGSAYQCFKKLIDLQ